MSIVPAIVTFPVASRVTGVLAAFRVNFTVTPLGMFTVVKWKTPLAGNVSVVFVAGLSAPSAPVLPLLKVCPRASDRPEVWTRIGRRDRAPFGTLVRASTDANRIQGQVCSRNGAVTTMAGDHVTGR
jgi:hypothetical protein